MFMVEIEKLYKEKKETWEATDKFVTGLNCVGFFRCFKVLDYLQKDYYLIFIKKKIIKKTIMTKFDINSKKFSMLAIDTECPTKHDSWYK